MKPFKGIQIVLWPVEGDIVFNIYGVVVIKEQVSWWGCGIKTVGDCVVFENELGTDGLNFWFDVLLRTVKPQENWSLVSSFLKTESWSHENTEDTKVSLVKIYF